MPKMNVRCVQVVLFFSASNCAFSNVYYMYSSLCNNVIGLPSPCFSFFRLVSSLWLFIFSTFEHTFTITLMFAHSSVSLSLITKLLFCLLRLCSSSIHFSNRVLLSRSSNRLNLSPFFGFAHSTSHRWKINGKSTTAMIIITVVIIPMISTSPTR